MPISTEKPLCPPTAQSYFFGQYLVHLGAITQETLQQALDFQRQKNQLLGELAISKGYLNQDQVRQVIAEQQRLDLPMGVIALRKGWLKARQLDDLLFAQVVATTHVGEALVELEYLAPAELAAYLNDFNTQEKNREALIAETFGRLSHSSLITAGIEALNKAFSRFAHEPTTIVSIGASCASHYKWSFAIHLELNDASDIWMEVSLSEQNALNIATSLAVSEHDALCDLRCLGRNNLFFTIVKRYFAMDIQDAGKSVMTAKLVKANRFTPRADQSCRDANELCVLLASPVGIIQVHFFLSNVGSKQ
jgi:hypothetical protein